MPFNTETARIAGKKGGKSFKAKYGLKALSKIGKKGAKAKWNKK